MEGEKELLEKFIDKRLYVENKNALLILATLNTKRAKNHNSLQPNIR